MQPGRMSTLSMEEEEAGVKATWRGFDGALWLASFGDASELVKVVADPAEFMQTRQDAVIGFSDQIPVWVKIARGKQVYCGDEVKKRKATADFKLLQHKRKLERIEEEKQAKKEAEEKKKAAEEENKEAEDDKKEAEEEKKAAEEEKKEAEEDKKDAEENKKEAEEEEKEAAKEAEEQNDSESDEDMPALISESGCDGEDDMKKVFMKEVHVDDPAADSSEDETMEQEVMQTSAGVLA